MSARVAQQMNRLRRPEPAFAGEDPHGREHQHEFSEPDQDMARVAALQPAVAACGRRRTPADESRRPPVNARDHRPPPATIALVDLPAQ